MSDLMITTPRLILRPPRMEDAEEITRAKQEVWDELQLWMNWAYNGEETLEATRNYIDITLADLAKGAPHLIGFCRETGKLVILTGATPYQEQSREFSTGYWVTKDFLGKGYATEGTNAAIRYAFNALGAETMHVSYYDDNDNSRRIIEKLGFEFTHTEAGGHNRCLDGKPMDEHHYVLRSADNLPDLEVRWEGIP